MKKLLLTYFCFLFSFCFAEQGVHRHGVANGEFLIDDAKISIQLTIPADSIVGYEHQPETKSEKEAYKHAIERLEEDALFTFFEESRYLKRKKQIQVTLDKQDINFKVNDKIISINSDDDHHSRNHQPHLEGEYHAEFEINLVYGFSEQPSLDSFSTALFERFPGIKIVDVKLIAEDNARHIKLKSSKMRYALRGD